MRYEIPDGYRVVYKYVPVQAKRTPKGMRPPKFSDSVTAAKRPPMTIATHALVYAPGKDEVPVAMGVAILNPTDNFNKRIGREIARGRAAKALAAPFYFTIGDKQYASMPANIGAWAHNLVKKWFRLPDRPTTIYNWAEDEGVPSDAGTE